MKFLDSQISLNIQLKLSGNVQDKKKTWTQIVYVRYMHVHVSYINTLLTTLQLIIVNCEQQYKRVLNLTQLRIITVGCLNIR